MEQDTVEAVIACAERLPFATADITGGAPELLIPLPRLVKGLAPRVKKLIIRTNLMALSRPESAGLPDLYQQHRLAITASLPATNAGQTEAQRGSGVWETSIAMLRRLNSLGYGREGSGLELDLVANPAGAFLPADQKQTERKFRADLERRHGIAFNRLFTFANVPMGRFLDWLERSGNLEAYRTKLEGSFNPCTVSGLMCRTLISVNWDGYLYDCDFNLAAGLPHGERLTHISELSELPPEGTPIPVGDHCYACTAGSGFT
jgi:radical SAM/Cys-rich protein